MSDLLALAERCEAATGPHRELDALIWCALNGKRYKDHFPVEFGGGQALGHTRVEFTEPPRRTRLVSGQHCGGDALPYTASLDAAMTLVPEGDSFTVGQNVHHGHWVASVNYLNDDRAPQARGCSNACR